MNLIIFKVIISINVKFIKNFTEIYWQIPLFVLKLLGIMLKYDLNPAIISACRTEDTLNHYVDCLENNKLDNFNAFKIEYRMNPIAVVNQDNI